LATALCILGEKEGRKLATAYGVTAYFASSE
jgi:thiamine biosynthesis lipoprotein ApbE